MRRSEIRRLWPIPYSPAWNQSEAVQEPDGDGLYWRAQPDGSKPWPLRDQKADGEWLGLAERGNQESGALIRYLFNS
ncbi:hypothetical protein PSEUDO8AS_100233 [Pseudomonas sp. 8AS]|uniref:hypothetical protein n=1 Tax=Pseudomonas sp. 8AS TaxID=2653163 RepID=UPI0012F363CA|nr:hypothetical protein [Pseudomonas sp. 8AS]VXB43227.1 hypothetical protein PSEUDO8AS_100233 [Pseudomonas sp. 8AS]